MMLLDTCEQNNMQSISQDDCNVRHQISFILNKDEYLFVHTAPALLPKADISITPNKSSTQASFVSFHMKTNEMAPVMKQTALMKNMPSHSIRRPRKSKLIWEKKHDTILTQLVQYLGPKWRRIARYFQNRTAKNCRERYFCHLYPGIRNDPWTEKEDAILMECHSRLGNHWADIKPYLPGRSNNSIKNRYYAMTRRSHRRSSAPLTKVQDK